MIENKPSKTAEFVVKGVYTASELLNRNGVQCIKSELISQNKTLVESLFPKLKKTLYKKFFILKMNFLDRFTVKGFHQHFIARKSEILSQVDAAIKNGCEQVVIIGAGYDTLSLVLSNQHKNVNIIEIDFPATQNYKLKKVASLYRDAKNVSFAPHDIEKLTLENLLLQHSAFKKDTKTVFVCEGVTMYLSDSAIDELLKTLSIVSAAESYFVFSFMDKLNNSINFRNQFPVMRWYLKLKGEKFTWGIEEKKLESFLRKRNFQLLSIADENSMKKYFSPSVNVHLAAGEKIAVAKNLKSNH